MIAENLKLSRTKSANNDFIELIKLLDKELFSNYGEQQVTYNKHNQVDELNTVLLIYYNDEAVGCGCFRPFTDDKTAEIKRMYVKKPWRGKGLSKIILNELEKWAVEDGFLASVLETGALQHEAIGLYQQHGYQEIDNYGEYQHLVDSICFRKELV